VQSVHVRTRLNTGKVHIEHEGQSAWVDAGIAQLIGGLWRRGLA
jgi:hypothetical protein